MTLRLSNMLKVAALSSLIIL